MHVAEVKDGRLLQTHQLDLFAVFVVVESAFSFISFPLSTLSISLRAQCRQASNSGSRIVLEKAVRRQSVALHVCRCTEKLKKKERYDHKYIDAKAGQASTLTQAS